MSSLAIAQNSASNEAPNAQVPALKVPTSQVAGPEEKSFNGDGFSLDRHGFVHFQKFNSSYQESSAVKKVMSVNSYTHACYLIWSTVSTKFFREGKESPTTSLSFCVGVNDWVPGTCGYDHYRGYDYVSFGRTHHFSGGWYVGSVRIRSTHFPLYTVEVLKEVLSSLRVEMTGKHVKNDNCFGNHDIYFGKDVTDLISSVEKRCNMIALALKKDIKKRFGIEEPTVKVDFGERYPGETFQNKLIQIDAEYQRRR